MADININEAFVRRAIAGDRKALSLAFSWCRTPQGDGYWRCQFTGHTPIDVAALKAMLGEDDRLAVLEQALGDAIEALRDLVEKYEEVVTQPDVGRSLSDYDLVNARSTLARLKQIADAETRK
jgi:hypothetical protein